ncbi:MAG: folate family ECF transporter S component [Eubacterium sp.]|nr:folate family ECF transporter S component [Eubacterium sp.]
MKKIVKAFKDSAKEFKNTRSLAVIAMFLALAVILGFFAVQLTESLKISFAFLANELTGMLFGPFVGLIEGGAADILKYIVKPTGPFFPGFTISGMLSGMIYGLVLYKKPVSLKRIIIANSIVTVFVNMLLNTYWLTLLYGKGFTVILPARIIKEAILLPIDIALFYLVSKALEKTNVFKAFRPGIEKAPTV